MPPCTKDYLDSLRAKHPALAGELRGLSAKALRERLAPLAGEIRKLADAVNAGDKPRDFTAEEQAKWQTVNEHYELVKAEAEEAENPLAARNYRDRLAALDTELRSPAGDPRVGRDDLDGRHRAAGAAVQVTAYQKALAMQAWFRAQSGMDLTDEQQQAARLCNVNPRLRNYDFNLFAVAPRTAEEALNYRPDYYAAGLSGQGGGASAQVLVPEGFVNRLERAMLAFGGMRQVAEIMRTETGADMPWPTANDTANKGSLVSEVPTLTDVNPSFGAKVMHAYTYTSNFLKVPVVLLEDAAVNLPGLLGDMAGERVGRIQNDHYTTGTGNSQPSGIVTDATLGVTAASSTAIAADELIQLVHSIDPAYRTPGCGWMFHDQILFTLRKFKDGVGRYLWQPGLTTNAPETFLEWPYTINQSMASSVATGNKTAIFGQLAKYKIRDVSQSRLRRLDERFADTDQVAFVLLTRSDGKLLDAGVAPVKYLAQP